MSAVPGGSVRALGPAVTWDAEGTNGKIKRSGGKGEKTGMEEDIREREGIGNGALPGGEDEG